MSVQENWSPILGYEGAYSVSDQGRIKSHARTMNDKYGGRIPIQERIMKTNPNSSGYPSLTLSKGGKQKLFPVHTLVSIAFLGPRPDGMQVDHINGIKTDNRAENLQYLSPLENLNKRQLAQTPCELISVSTGVGYWAPSNRAMSRALGLQSSSLSRLNSGKLKQTGGYRLPSY